MGNCMETYRIGQQQHQQGEEERGFGKNGLSMKVVLTKEELKWLMLQLNQKGEGLRLEQMLAEIERSREQKVDDEGWKPSLESILEAPEMLEMDTTSHE